jgi:integral membrane protein (TIGR01906 family)
MKVEEWENMMGIDEKRREYRGLQWMLALVLTWVFICLAVTLVLRGSLLYELDIRNMGLAEELEVSEAFILEQYQALIAYNLPGGPDTLVFPGLPSSENALQHFVEAKEIFMVFQIGLWIGLAISVCGIILLRKRRPLYLKYAGILSLAFPASIGLCALLFWQQFFVLFHQLFFRNDFWLFDAVTDPIILLLPDQYFLHCAIAIVALTILCGMISWVCYLLMDKRRRSINHDEKARTGS